MMPPRPIDDIVNDALDLPAPKRRGFVHEACDGDAAVESEVMSLLAAYDSAGDFLESPPVLDAAIEDDQAGRDIGGYRLVERIGTGGMGDVYLARRLDAHYDQQVAVKVVRGAVFGPEAVRRFRNECRVLAMLEHPNIARMLEGGFGDDGVPYIVMEYVDGVPIDRYCDDNDLTVEQRLDLIQRLCAAVQHIHQHSTIHRDIKCANVLVAADGSVKLVDFGIAQVLDAADDEHMLTKTGMEVMTPQYASPEQLRGDVLTTASDVYSLGVVLYRVLTGRLPFTGRNRREMERIVEDTAPTRPSVVAGSSDAADARRLRSRRLRGDIDTIVMMALRKEPERRYSSAEQLGEDIRRHLAGLPVVARGDSVRYRTGKFVRRNRWAVAGLALFLVTLCGAVVTGFVLYTSADRARRVAVRERAAAVRVNAFLQELMAAANPAQVDARPDVTVREVLDEAARRLDAERPDDPAVVAALHTTIGASYLNLGAFEQAHAQFERALELHGSLSQPDRSGHARALMQFGMLHEKRAEYGPAEEYLRRAIELLGGEARPDAALVAECEMNLTLVLVESARLQEAEEQALAARETAARISDPRSPIPVSSVSAHGRVLFRAGRYEESEALFADAVRMAREALGDRHALTGEVLQNHAVVLGALGRTTEAIEEYQEALAVYAAAYPEHHPELGTTRLNLADAYSTEGRHAEALASYEIAEGILSDAYGPDHAYVGLAVNGEALCRWKLEGPEAARPLFERAIACLRAGLGDSHPWVAAIANNLARVRFELDDTDGALREAKAALSSMSAAYPDGHVTMSRPLLLIADIELERGRPAEALAAIEEAATYCDGVPPTNRDLIGVTLTRADCLAALDRHAEAEALLVGARAAVDSLLSADDERVQRIDDRLARIRTAGP